MLGEEEGDDGNATRWIVDPIDGTKNFARGVPVWATLIALEREGEIVCGVVSAPALGHRWWAGRGAGAFCDGKPIRVSAVRSLAEASVSATYARDLGALEPAAWHARSLGDFWQHALVAEGAVDAAIDARLAVGTTRADPDRRAGGGRSRRSTAARRARTSRSSTSNGAVHDELLALLT